MNATNWAREQTSTRIRGSIFTGGPMIDISPPLPSSICSKPLSLVIGAFWPKPEMLP